MTSLELPSSLRPDLEVARAFLRQQALPGTLIQCGITGSHFYGFPSPDSDVDLKGVHLAPTRELLGLSPPNDTYDRIEEFEGVECDVTTHEAAKALSLLLKGNGNILERLLSPFQLVFGPEQAALAALAEACVAKKFYRHYRGFFGGMQREHLRDQTAKTLLYSYRVALTGIHLLRTGAMVGDVRELAPLYGYGELLDVVALKSESHEQCVLEESLGSRLRERWIDLEDSLAQALAESSLPAVPPNQAAMNDWLVETRLAHRAG